MTNKNQYENENWVKALGALMYLLKFGAMKLLWTLNLRWPPFVLCKYIIYPFLRCLDNSGCIIHLREQPNIKTEDKRSTTLTLAMK